MSNDLTLWSALHAPRSQPMDLIDPRSFDAAGKVLWMPSIITGLLYVVLCALVYHSVATSIAQDRLSTFADMWESVFKIALLAFNYILVGGAFITHAKSQVTGFSLGGMAGFILGTTGGWLYFVPTGGYAFFMISSISGGLIGSSLRFGKAWTPNGPTSRLTPSWSTVEASYSRYWACPMRPD
jgi:hypothetical protein